jgi:uncharacterized RDD family membrane protein YckC
MAPLGDPVGFWRRAGAGLLDLVAYTPLAFALVVLGPGPGYWQAPEEAGLSVMLAVGYLLPAAYLAGFWALAGTTPGKWVLGLRVVRSDGSRLGPGRALLRYLGYLISALPLWLGFVWIAFDRQKRGWHDLLADTRVVRETAGPVALPTIARRLG